MEIAGTPTAGAEFRRKNGLARPWDPLQMLSWLLFAYLNVSFYFLLAPLLETSAAWSFVVILAALGAAVFGLAFHCSRTDSVDKTPTVTNARSSMDLLYCYYCKRQVHKRSKHCRACNKCVSHFDHHCRWLNCCIGGPTYKHFFALIVLVLCFVGVHLACGGVVLYDWIHWFNWQGNTGLHGSTVFATRGGVMAFVVVTELISLAAFGMIANLVFFHIFLMKNNMTTYDYIVKQREQKSRRRTRIAPETEESSRRPPAVVSKWTGDEKQRSHDEEAPSTPSASEFVMDMPSMTRSKTHTARTTTPSDGCGAGRGRGEEEDDEEEQQHHPSTAARNLNSNSYHSPSTSTSASGITTPSFKPNSSPPQQQQGSFSSPSPPPPPRMSRLPLPAELLPMASSHPSKGKEDSDARDSWDGGPSGMDGMNTVRADAVLDTRSGTTVEEDDENGTGDEAERRKEGRKTRPRSERSRRKSGSSGGKQKQQQQQQEEGSSTNHSKSATESSEDEGGHAR